MHHYIESDFHIIAYEYMREKAPLLSEWIFFIMHTLLNLLN